LGQDRIPTENPSRGDIMHDPEAEFKGRDNLFVSPYPNPRRLMDVRRAAVTLSFLSLASLTLPAQNKGAEWGKYLAEEVGKCQDCHTPRTAGGKLDEKRWMKGAVLNVQPIRPIPKWHKEAPDLTPAGKLWKTWGEEGIVKFLSEGVTPRGTSAGPPMATYKLRREDARAIVDYLKSLQ
jgi:mono/diheme cytochrome c family protein